MAECNFYNDDLKLAMESNIVPLQINEHVLHDNEQVTMIFRDLGAVSADQIVTRALAELAVTMTSISDLLDKNEMADLAKKLRRLQSMAENIGMISLALVAADLRECAAQQDRVAFAAVCARLMRVAEKSLKQEHPLLGGGAQHS